MARPCTICAHSKRREIDEALVSRASFCAVSRTFSVGRDALRRHTKEHLPALLAKAHDAEEVARAGDLLEEVGALKGRTMAILDEAEASGELKTALAAIREARGNLELLARLAGELNDAPTVNLYLSPEWMELRAAIVVALEPHEEAKNAVLAALEVRGGG